MFKHKTLRSALAEMRPNDVIFAQDISDSGKKVFFAGTIERAIDSYQKVEQKHWYECLLENRPTRLFLDVESTKHVDIDSIVDGFKMTLEHKYHCRPEFTVLSSCSESKTSYHVVADIFFKNPYHVGAFVRRTLLFLREKIGDMESVDTAVYTKNRMFRVAGSRKFGSSRVLTHPSKQMHECLVQSPLNPSCVYECLEIDQTEPSSTSLAPSALFYMGEDNNWHRNTPLTVSRTLQSVDCPVLNPVLDFLDRSIDAKTCRHNMRLSTSGQYYVSTRSKKCAIAGRAHRGNNIWLMLDLNKCVVYQKCYDDECHRKVHVVNVPKNVWEHWSAGWNYTVDVPINQMTLFNTTN